MRRYAGTDVADRYQEVLAFQADGSHDPPGVAQRTLGDHLDPSRPDSVEALINAATLRSGIDAADWTYRRVVGMVRQLESE